MERCSARRARGTTTSALRQLLGDRREKSFTMKDSMDTKVHKGNIKFGFGRGELQLAPVRRVMSKRSETSPLEYR